jgi:beta-N-acetylhexosaminidase
LSETIALEAVTIIKNEDSMLPLNADRSGKLGVLVPSFDALTKVEEAAEPHEILLAELKRRHGRVHYMRVPVQPSQAEIADCLKTCKSAETLLILTYNMHIYPSQAELVQNFLDIGKPAAVAAVRDPYDLMFAQKARALVATYGFRGCSLKALVKVLFGEAEAKGRLPVDLGPPQS